MHVSIDGRTERPDGTIDWVGDSADSYDFELFDRVDACVLGRVMYPEYAQYWRAIAAGSTADMEEIGATPTAENVRYAQFADRTPHYVLGRTTKELDWPVARAASDIGAIAALRDEPGRDIYVVGGATTVAAVLNEGLLNELRLTVHPLIVGEGTSLFAKVAGEHRFDLVGQQPLDDGSIRLVYRI